MKRKVPKTAGAKMTHKVKVDNSMKVKGKPKAVGLPKMKSGYTKQKGVGK